MTDTSDIEVDFLILGAGSAGCVLANRLSANGARQVLLVEAGKDHLPGAEPKDILDSYFQGAAFNPAYHWRELRVRLAHEPGNAPAVRPPLFMEQARVVGGGSSINAQMANRGSPEDYDEWQSLGARGWGWDQVLPYFRKLETDLDLDGPFHGNDGPIAIRRAPEPEWTEFSHAVVRGLTEWGMKALPDQNGLFEDGWFPVTISNRADRRVSAAIGYLDAAVRRRPNLRILSQTIAERLCFDGRRASGAVLNSNGRRFTARARHVVVSAGALHTPALLMRSGIGPGGHLREHGVAVLADRPGVGANLMEHPTVAVSAYLTQAARLAAAGRRHAHVAFRYSSAVAECGASDMYVSVTAKSSWHAVGVRLASFLMWCNKPYSRGRVMLSGVAPETEPDVHFNMLADRRDYERLADGIRRLAALYATPAVREVARDPFPTSYSERVRRIGTVSTKNKILTSILATILDGPAPLRRLAIRHFITQGQTLDGLLHDEARMESYIRDSVTGCWHPSGTCRMGAADDPMAVTDPAGRVYGVDGLTVCDASIFPSIPRANINIPTIMCAEKIADGLGGTNR